MTARQRRSKVWLYFTQKDDHRATCNACKTSLSSKGGKTTIIPKHLSILHAITLQECHVFERYGATITLTNLNQATAARLTLALQLVISKVNSSRPCLCVSNLFHCVNQLSLFVYVSFIFSSRRKHFKKKKKQHCNWQVQILFSTAVLKLWYIKDP